MDRVAPEDQVPRLQAFKESHPDIRIVPPSRFSPSWVASRDGENLLSRHNLKGFLDALDELVSR